MAEILIQGGDAEAAADALAAVIRDIFAAEPRRIGGGGTPTPDTRSLELAAIVLALPSAVIGTADLIARAQLGPRLRRLAAKAAALRQRTHATILIDPGDGKHIPLEEANHDQIVAALHRIEQHLKR